ncbi:MAG: mannosyltransferase family protein [Actinomycetes bacterium]
MAGSRTGLTARSTPAVWFASRVAVAVTAGAAIGSFGAAWLRGWYHWDVALYIKVAQFGYGGFPRHYPDSGIAAFFPGLPLALRAVHTVVSSWVASGLIVSLLASGVACVALARLADMEGTRGPGAFAVLALVVSPYAVFLAAGYSESLFLAFALPAWIAARRRSWAAAGLLAAGASATRVTGLFLAAALFVEYAVVERRLRRDAVWLFAPLVTVGLFVWHLHHVLGDWLAWPHAESRVWGRHFTWPWLALHHTLQYARAAGGHHDFVVQYYADLAAAGVGVALTVYLLWRRSYGEMTYVGLQVVALTTSSYYLSIGRATLLWWPLWILIGRAMMRRPAVAVGYVAVSAPLMVTMVVGFTAANWWVG